MVVGNFIIYNFKVFDLNFVEFLSLEICCKGFWKFGVEVDCGISFRGCYS